MDQSLRQWEKIIIGIDPGTNVMGYGLLGVRAKQPQLIVMGVLKLSRMDDHYMRLHRIYERVTGLVRQYLPDEIKDRKYYRAGDNKSEQSFYEYLKRIKGKDIK